MDGLIDEDYSIEDIVESSMMVSSVLDILEVMPA